MPSARNKKPSFSQLQKLLQEFASSLKKHPDDLETRLKLAEVLRLLGRDDDAISVYRSAAWTHASRGNLLSAIMLCKLILELKPNHRETQNMLARLFASKQVRDRKQSIPVRQVNGHWIADPKKPSSTQDDSEVQKEPGNSKRSFSHGDSVAIESVFENLSDMSAAPPGPMNANEEITLGTSELEELRTGEERRKPNESNVERARVKDESIGNREVRTSEKTRDRDRDPMHGRIPVDPFAQTGPAKPVDHVWDHNSLHENMVHNQPSKRASRKGSRSIYSAEEETVGSPIQQKRRGLSKERAKLLRDEHTSAPIINNDETPPSKTPSSKTPSTPPFFPDQETQPGEDRSKSFKRISGDPMDITVKETETDSNRQCQDHDDLGSNPYGSDLNSGKPESAHGRHDHGRHGNGRPLRSTKPMPSPTMAALLIKDAELAYQADKDALGFAAIARQVREQGNRENETTLAPEEQKKLESDLQNRIVSLKEDFPNTEDQIQKLPNTEEDIQQLPDALLFSDLPSEAFVALIDLLTRRVYDEGDVVLEEGNPGDSLFLVSSGYLEVLKNDKGKEIHLGVLSPGLFFGEFGLLTDQKRHATVKCSTECELLELTKKDFENLEKDHPAVGKTVRSFYGKRVMDMIMATSPLFQEVKPENSDAILAKFHFERVNSGKIIVEQGQNSSFFYVILLGQVEVFHKDENSVQTNLAFLSEGDYFGELSMLTGRPPEATVRSTRTTDLLRLSREDFYDLVSAHPEIWHAVDAESRRRRETNAKTITASRKAKAGLL